MATVRELVTKIRFSVDQASIRAATTATNNLKSTLSRVSASTRAASSSLSRFASDFRGGFKAGFAAEFDRLAQSSARASRNISSVGASASSAFSSLRSLAGAVAAYVSVSKIKETADEMMNLDGKLRTVTETDEERYEVEEKLYKISQANRQELGAIGDLYYKVARGARQFGVSQEESLRVTDIVSKALVSASPTEARSAILQLGQALGSGRLQGDELRSLDENASLLMQHIAAHMGTTVGGLKELGSKGELTSEAVIKAILASGDAIDKEFAKMPKTVGQALEVVSNGFSHFIMKVERRMHIFGGIANTIIGVFNRIEKAMDAFGNGEASIRINADSLESIRENFSQIFEDLAEYSSMLGDFITPLIEPLMNLGTTIIEFLSGVFAAFITGFVDEMRKNAPEMAGIFQSLADGIENIRYCIEKLMPFAKILAEALGRNLANAVIVMGRIVTGVFEGITEVVGALITLVDTFISRWRQASMTQSEIAASNGGWSYGGDRSVTINNEYHTNSAEDTAAIANDTTDYAATIFSGGRAVD